MPYDLVLMVQRTSDVLPCGWIATIAPVEEDGASRSRSGPIGSDNLSK
jgi:hypothetical protein